MPLLGSILLGVGGLIVLVCHVIVIVKMFQAGQTGLGILAIVLTCFGFGVLFTLIYGWAKANQWRLRNVMLTFTAGVVLEIAGLALNPAQLTDIQARLQQRQPAP
jgi:hypothetical protein